MPRSKRRSNGLVVALAAVVLAAGGWFGWRWYSGGDEGVAAEEDAATPAVARAAETRLVRFLQGEGEAQLRLTETEVTALVRYTYDHALPAGVSNVRVFLRQDVVDIRLSSEPAKIRALPGLLAPVLGVVADTVGVEIEGGLEIVEGGRAMFLIDRIKVVGVPLPLPDRFVPLILEAIDRRSAPGLPSNSVVVLVPAALGGIQVEDGALVLARR